VQVAGVREPPGDRRGEARVQKGAAGERAIERLELLGRLHQKRRGVASAATRSR